MTEDGVRVEQLGFEFVWLPDHFYYLEPSGLETYPEVWTLLTAIGSRPNLCGWAPTSSRQRSGIRR
jgi:alkanesulfonate monooxygenase SsuD/methylene tetrahydromethanopterin reductase-like flavin-dependent oxidoreductase (luciferase family)